MLISRKIELEKIGSLNLKVLLAAFLSFSMAAPVTAQVKKTNFGLGTPRTGDVSGAVRTGANCPKIALITPSSGSKTLLAQPTLLWYVEASSPVDITLILRGGDSSEFGNKAPKNFSAKGEAKSSGLYSFALPQSAPALTLGQVQRWDLRIQSADCSDSNLVRASAAIQLDRNPQVVAAIAKSTNELQKARIYSEGGYWFDALSAYDRWLKANSKDLVALKERNSAIANGFQDYEVLSKAEPSPVLDFIKLVPKKIESTTATPITLTELKSETKSEAK
jgi:hypothetical protein